MRAKRKRGRCECGRELPNLYSRRCREHVGSLKDERLRQRPFKRRVHLTRPRIHYANQARLTVLVTSNPHRPKTHAFKLFEVMRVSPTLGDYRKLGTKVYPQAMAYLIAALAKEYIKLEL